MQIVAPVTDYIPASLLTTLGDIVVRGAAGAERLAGADWRGVHIGNSSRNAGGDQVIEGVGFPSSIIILLGVTTVGADLNWSIGFDDGTIHNSIFVKEDGAAVGLSTAYSISISGVGMNSIYGTVTAIGADGFTITWGLMGAEAVDFIYLCRP